MRTKILAYGLLSTIFLVYCGQNKADHEDKTVVLSEPLKIDSTEHLKHKQIDSIFGSHQDSVKRILFVEQKQRNKIAIIAAEKDFYKSLKGFDRDFHENNFERLQEVLSKHKISPYELYLELSEINNKSKQEAIKKAISTGLQERKFTDFIKLIKDNYVSEFQSKYGIDNRLYLCFKNNYCSCLGENSYKYCVDRNCTLPNADYSH